MVIKLNLFVFKKHDYFFLVISGLHLYDEIWIKNYKQINEQVNKQIPIKINQDKNIAKIAGLVSSHKQLVTGIKMNGEDYDKV